jgi:hypothetical protein
VRDARRALQPFGSADDGTDARQAPGQTRRPGGRRAHRAVRRRRFAGSGGRDRSGMAVIREAGGRRIEHGRARHVARGGSRRADR